MGFLSCLASFGQGPSAPAAAKPAEAPHAKAGGVDLAVPGPGGFPEVGDRLRTTVFEVLTPTSNRLLTAYVPAETLAELSSGKIGDGLRHYAMLEVPRQGEYVDCTPEAFAQVQEGMEAAMGKLDSKTLGDAADELNLRLKSLGSKPLEAGRPEPLGGLYKKPSSSGFAMLLAFKQGERSFTMVTAIGVLRVKQRILFAYLYQRYESPQTVHGLGKELEMWTDALLAGNQ